MLTTWEEMAYEVRRWREGAEIRLLRRWCGNFLRLVKRDGRMRCETAWGVAIDYEDARLIWDVIRALVEGGDRMVGSPVIELGGGMRGAVRIEVDADGLAVGCQDFSWIEVEMFAAALGWPAIEWKGVRA